MKARDVMITEVVTVTPDTTVDQLARLFIEKNISGAPVVSEDGVLVGIVSEGDLVYQQKPVDAPYFFNFLGGIIQVEKKEFLDELMKVGAYLVKELMSKKVVTAGPDEEINTIASLMINRGINRVPIVDEEHRVIGLITRQDIIKHIYL